MIPSTIIMLAFYGAAIGLSAAVDWRLGVAVIFAHWAHNLDRHR